MIDTDKYEGHTEGLWKWFEGEGHKDLQSNMAFLMFGEVGKSQYPKPADAALIADAPLLLAEVERLRMYEVGWKILYDNAREEERETRTRTWKEIMELVRSDVREMVDESYPCFDEWLNSSIGGFE